MALALSERDREIVSSSLKHKVIERPRRPFANHLLPLPGLHEELELPGGDAIELEQVLLHFRHEVVSYLSSLGCIFDVPVLEPFGNFRADVA